MKCLNETIVWLLLSMLILHRSSTAPAKKTVRNGKFMAFTADDMFSDLLDDIHDPLPVAGAFNEKEKYHRMNDSFKTTTARPKINDTKMTKLPVKTEEKIALYNQDTGKFELITTTSGHFSFPIKPVTENGVFFYGGQHYQYRRPMPPQQHNANRTEEIKIFWSAVGDAIENSPYFPIQINVPDMITAMTNFLVNYIPFINRLTNPNQPRLPYPVAHRNQTNHPIKYHHPIDYYENYDVYQNENSINRREFKNGDDPEEKASKERRKTKRKSNKKKNSSKTKGIFPRPNFRVTTSPPVEDIKLWHQFGSDTKETLRLKNMPITRKRVRVADREIFNFKNSDISNSPIMILNVPHRPITHYKLTHQEVKEKEVKQDRNQQQFLQPQQLTPSLSLQPQGKSQVQTVGKSGKQTKQSKQNRRKSKIESKPKRSSKRSGRSDFEVTEQNVGGKP